MNISNFKSKYHSFSSLKFLKENESIHENIVNSFDCDRFLSNVVKLHNHNLDAIFEIEKQLTLYKDYNTPVIKNSILPELIMRFIENVETSNFSPEFLLSALKICSLITARKGEDFSVFVNQKLIQSFFTLMESSNDEFKVFSFLCFANTCFINENTYSFCPKNLFQTLINFLKLNIPINATICSVVLKKITKFIHKNPNDFDAWIGIAEMILQTENAFAKMKIIRAIPKLIQSELNFLVKYNNFIVSIFNSFHKSQDLFIFGNILYLLMSIIDFTVYEDFSQKSLFSSQKDKNHLCVNIIFQYPLLDIIKNGLLFDHSTIQKSSAEILCFFIDNIELLSSNKNCDLIEVLFHIVDVSNYDGKEKVKKVLYHLFWRTDLLDIFEKIFKLGGLQFLVDNLTADDPYMVIQTLNRIIMMFPDKISELYDLGIFHQIDNLILSCENNDSQLLYAAQALKEDIINSGQLKLYS